MSNIKMKNHLQQMRGQSTNIPQKIKKHRNFTGESWSVEVSVDPIKAQQLKSFMQNELDFYNNMVDCMRPTLASSPEKFLEFNDSHINMFSLLAENCLNINDILRNPPPEFEKFQTIFKDKSITEYMKIIMESAKLPSGIATTTRKAMAKEVLMFNIAQASQKTKKVSLSSSNVFRNVSKTLSNQDIISKRHLQITKESINISWNSKNEESIIQTPYATFTIPNIDLSEKKSWNIMIIHQAPNILPDFKTPWCLDFRGTPQSYLVEYLDQQNNKLGVFFQAKPNKKGK